MLTAPVADRPARLEPQVYSLSEFATLMGISHRHAGDLAREGRIPGLVRLGAKYVVPKWVVEEMLGRAPQIAK